jgi:hypothetical protein
LHRSEGATSLLWPLSWAPRAATPRNLLPATPSAATKGGEESGVAERRVGQPSGATSSPHGVT